MGSKKVEFEQLLLVSLFALVGIIVVLAGVYRFQCLCRDAKGLSKPKAWPEASKRVQADWPSSFDDGATEFPWESGWADAGRFYPYDLGAVIAWRHLQPAPFALGPYSWLC
ncbi:MAG: hypothetical protein AAFV69_01315, partial [Pseudomonadota bacterium]